MHHHHHPSGTRKVLIVSLAATLAFVLVQVWSGVYSGSLALLSDAGHNLTDALALGLALFGVYLQAKPADDEKTFGYHRAGVLAAFVNALSLIALSVYLFIESYQRLRTPQAVDEPTMVGVALLGIALNVGILLGLRHGNDDLNIRAASIHMLSDALGSVAIVIGAVAIRYTGWTQIDPLLSILIGMLIVWSAVDIIRESLNILLEGLPRGIKLNAVIASLRNTPGVLDVHDVHVWSLSANTHALSCHALIEDMPPSESEEILQCMNRVLVETFRISHATIQFEHVNCSPSGSRCCTLTTHS